MSLIEVTDLSVDFGSVRAVDKVSFTLEPGAALGVVGESGSGKSTVAYALLGLHRGTGASVAGAVEVAGVDVAAASDPELRALRGGKAAMVFQDPLSALDPYYAVGDQIAEVYRVHRKVSRRAARARAVEVLDRVGIADAARRSRSRPHEFSGGMRQRALIAMALACEPRVLIADEPTTALDVTVQAQILDLLHELRAETGLGLLLVTHDVGVAAESVDDILVMRHGKVVERGPVGEVLAAPSQAYTRELLAAVPRIEGAGRASVPGPRFEAEAAAPAGAGEPVLEARDLRKVYGKRAKAFTAVDGVSVAVHAGETLGIVGESGSGKTTLGRMLVGLLAPDGGSVSRTAEVQMVFQDPGSALNPRRSIGESIADPLRARGEKDEGRIRARVDELLVRVGLEAAHYDRYPHEFSGGQRQRVCIARALAPSPRLIVCDEPVSSLDVTTQAQVLDLLDELRRELGLALVFIAHDLAVVRQVSDRVAVMRRGRVVESGTVAEVYGAPQDPYTKQLLAAVPALDPSAAALRRSERRELAEVA
ncbi:ABC transporter ATP-binding protein [Streptomyces sp. YC504]|uniref:ABC transporter ATP-binding protein n=1 Tax=Streptomyces mesophilus TaxID=1775132 RepID=A0A6G4XN89_9ACTN|nr:ABC transporter ATP-binding protein [Streptomyces mesophilus]NGO79049.1 ABC transporter ATP-binding protein [Streptomyces mesophilus]